MIYQVLRGHKVRLTSRLRLGIYQSLERLWRGICERWKVPWLVPTRKSENAMEGIWQSGQEFAIVGWLMQTWRVYPIWRFRGVDIVSSEIHWRK